MQSTQEGASARPERAAPMTGAPPRRAPPRAVRRRWALLGSSVAVYAHQTHWAGRCSGACRRQRPVRARAREHHSESPPSPRKAMPEEAGQTCSCQRAPPGRVARRQLASQVSEAAHQANWCLMADESRVSLPPPPARPPAGPPMHPRLHALMCTLLVPVPIAPLAQQGRLRGPCCRLFCRVCGVVPCISYVSSVKAPCRRRTQCASLRRGVRRYADDPQLNSKKSTFYR